uniref:cytochrome P450 4B1-like n=1 Tax=Styela clava TaxID=7725 RepID=UPI00193A42DA|nr:cytochrome P450 4B1-like [Styela clava]
MGDTISLFRMALWTAFVGITMHLLVKLSSWFWGQYEIRKCTYAYWPSLPYHWFWGHYQLAAVIQKSPEKMIEFIKSATDKFSHGTALYVGPLITYVRVYHENILKTILGGSEKNFPKTPTQYHAFGPWLGKGLLVLDGKEWQRRRRLLSNSFHFDILKSYAIKMNECSQVLVDKWSERLKSHDEMSVEIFCEFSLMTIDVILKCLMGFDSECHKEDSEHQAYVNSIYKVTRCAAQRFRGSILLRFDWIYYKTHDGKEYLKSSKDARDYAEKVINLRRKEYADGATIGSKLGLNRKNNRHHDFLDILLQAKDSDGNHLTEKEISDEVNTFMFEGHDTTTSAISWTCYCLATNPKHQDLCYDEISEILGDKEDLELNDLTNLPYLTMCIKEALRLYPPVPSITRSPTSDLNVDGKIIKKGTDVILSMLGVHHNSRLWPNPELYDPSRFTPENSLKRDPFSYIPFSAGIRNCIGQNFAMNEIKICVVHVLRNFHLALDETKLITESLELIYRSRTGIHLIVKKRSHNNE